MKKLFILFFLVGLSFGAAKYFLPFPVESSNGRPIADGDILVVPTGTTSGYISMTWLNAGWYYYTGGSATVATGAYDVAIVLGTDTTVWRSNIYLGNNSEASLTAQWRSDINDTVSTAQDTIGLKLNDAPEGSIAYLKQLSSANTYGGGWWVVKDSAHSESKSIIATGHPTAAKQWVRDDFLLNNEINVLWAGAIPDGSTDAAASIRSAIALTSENDGISIVFPSDSTFSIETALTLPDNDVRIIGNGASITNGTTNSLFYRTQHDNFTYIEGLTFYGGGPGFRFLAANNSTQYYEFEIRNCKFLQDSAAFAISLVGAREGKIENCYFLNNDGIYIQRSVNTEIINCDFKNTTYSVFADGDESAFSAGTRVMGGTSLGVDSAFVFRGGDYFTLDNVMADYCDNPVIIQAQNGGIINGGYYSSRISAPTILIDSTGAGLVASSQHIKIIGAEIVSNYTTAGDSTTIGISILDAAHTHIAYNTIHFWTKYGIKDSSSTFTTIDHNRIAPRSGFGESAGGVYSILDNSVNRITENNFDSGFGVTRSNALVYNNTNSGITAAGAATSVVIDSSSFANPGKIFYGGQSQLQEIWGSTGYIAKGANRTITFAKPFLTAAFGVSITPFNNPAADSTAGNWVLISANQANFVMRTFATDSATYFYRAIGY